MRVDNEIQVTVCIPVRVTKNTEFLLERLNFIEFDDGYSSYVKVLFVDDGSADKYSAIIKENCRLKNYEYKKLDTQTSVFSIGRCRNYAAMTSQTRYIFFQDIDLMPCLGFYEKLVNEIGVLGFKNNSNNMIMVPVSYLTKPASNVFYTYEHQNKYQYFTDLTINRDPEKIEKFSSGTSACLYDRYFYLACGGNDERFSGWGFEDLEFNHRVIKHSKNFPLPLNFQKDISSFDKQYEYQGWKSVYRLFGDRSLFKGLMLFHAWHEVDTNTGYARKKEINRKLFQEKITKFSNSGEEPDALPCLNSGKTLLFRKNPFTFDRKLQPLLGEVKLVNENSFMTFEAFDAYLKGNRITLVLFHNPYANPQMKLIYDWCRGNKIHFVISERGALNNSICFDRTGFLADSSLFEPKLWEKKLTPDQLEKVLNYISDQKALSQDTLEKQGARHTESELRKRLLLTRDEKLILVCFQRPTDTATCFFDDEKGSYYEFLEAVKELSTDIPEGYRLVCKRHPLEDTDEDVDCEFVNEIHLYDLFNLADILIVFNSGAGLQAMIWGVPVITWGKAFYDNEGITKSLSATDTLRDAIMNGIEFNQERFFQFLYYLLYEYYSFGDFETRQVAMDTGERITATTKIHFENLRFNETNINYYVKRVVKDSWQSMLFDRYQGVKGRAQTSRSHKPKVVAKVAVTEKSSSAEMTKMPNRWVRFYRLTRPYPVVSHIVGVFVPLYQWISSVARR